MGLLTTCPPVAPRPGHVPRTCSSCFPPDLPCTPPDFFRPPDFLKSLTLRFCPCVLTQPGVSREEPLCEVMGTRPVPCPGGGGVCPHLRRLGQGHGLQAACPSLPSAPHGHQEQVQPAVCRSRDGDAPDWAGPAGRSSVWEAGVGRAASEGKAGGWRLHMTGWVAGNSLVPTGKCPD